MSVAAYVIAVASVVIVLTGAGLAARATRVRLLPDAAAPLAVLVTATLLYGWLVVLGELLGSAVELRRGALLIGAAVLGVAGLLIAPVASPQRWCAAIRHRAPIRWTPVGFLAAVCVALVGGEALSSLDNSFRYGITFIDAIEYHLTWAAHFATTHSTRGYIHVLSGDATSYYPMNDELLHGIGMLLVGRDSLSLLLATVDVGLVLVAAYCIGARFGAGAIAVCAVTPVVVTLGYYTGQAINDWASLWPFLTAVAVLVHSRDRVPTYRETAVIGAALGLAIGVKVDLLVPALALSLGILVLCAGRRWLTAGLLFLSALVTGGYWYLRDWIVIGSPAPTEHIPGLAHVPTSIIDHFGFSVARYLFNAPVWRHFFVPGLHMLLGVAWPTVLLLAAWGTVAALRVPKGRGAAGRLMNVLGLVVVVAAIGYLVTPTTGLGPLNHPFLFPVNLRYAYPALLLGAVLVATTRSAVRFRLPIAVVLLAVEAIVVATGFTTWRTDGAHRPALAVATALVLTATTIVVTQRGWQRLTAAGLVLAALVAGYPLQQYYLRHRYQTTVTDQVTLFKALNGTERLRIGVVGYPAQYPYLGPQWRNTVHYVAVLGKDNSFEDYRTCTAWRQAASAYDVIVIQPSTPKAEPPQLAWTRSDPAATPVLRNSAGSIFRIGPGFGSAPCPAGS